MRLVAWYIDCALIGALAGASYKGLMGVAMAGIGTFIIGALLSIAGVL